MLEPSRERVGIRDPVLRPLDRPVREGSAGARSPAARRGPPRRRPARGGCAGAPAPRPCRSRPTPRPRSCPATPVRPSRRRARSRRRTFPLTLTDDEGTAVDLPAEPQKIVSLTPATTEILFAIGAGDRTVGKVEDLATYPPAADGVPVVATYQGVDVEKIVSARRRPRHRRRQRPHPARRDRPAPPGEHPGPRDLRHRRPRRPRRHRARRRRGRRGTGGARPDRVDAGRLRPGGRRDPGPRHPAHLLRDRRDQGDLRAGRRTRSSQGMIKLAGGIADHGRRRRAGHPAREARGGRPGGHRPRATPHTGRPPTIVAKRPGWGTMTAVKSGAIRPADDVRHHPTRAASRRWPDRARDRDPPGACRRRSRAPLPARVRARLHPSRRPPRPTDPWPPGARSSAHR